MAKPIYKNLTVQVLVAVAIGVFIGACWPNVGKSLSPLGEGFIRLVRMVIGPIIFLTIVHGIVSMGNLKRAGRVGVKAIIYFEIVTTLALVIGLLVANLLHPGSGVDTSKADMTKVAQYTQQAQQHTIIDFIPENIVGAFAKGDLLQIVFFSVLFGVAAAAIGMQHSPLMKGIENLIEVMFRVVAIIMRVAPLGALGAMAYTVGQYGMQALMPLIKLMACVYATMGLFILGVLGIICRIWGFRLLQFMGIIRHEIILALGTSSSESVLPRMIDKLESMGCGRSIVKMVIPAGYSFNMDGTSIYLSMAVVFLAQAFNVQMNFWDQVKILLVLMLTSKGSAGVTGAGFITLAATLSATRTLPLEGLSLLLGVDRFMSEARTITNLIGNGVATIVVSKMEGEFDDDKYRAAIDAKSSTIDELKTRAGLATSVASEASEIR